LSDEVNGALVHADGVSFTLSNGSDVNNRESGRKFFQEHLTEVSLFTITAKFPSSSFKRKTIDEGTLFARFGLFLGLEDILDFSLEAHIIERKHVFTGSDLHNGSQVGHRVEKSRKPNYIRSFEFR